MKEDLPRSREDCDGTRLQGLDFERLEYAESISFFSAPEAIGVIEIERLL